MMLIAPRVLAFVFLVFWSCFTETYGRIGNGTPLEGEEYAEIISFDAKSDEGSWSTANGVILSDNTFVTTGHSFDMTGEQDLRFLKSEAQRVFGTKTPQPSADGYVYVRGKSLTAFRGYNGKDSSARAYGESNDLAVFIVEQSMSFKRDISRPKIATNLPQTTDVLVGVSAGPTRPLDNRLASTNYDPTHYHPTNLIKNFKFERAKGTFNVAAGIPSVSVFMATAPVDPETQKPLSFADDTHFILQGDSGGGLYTEDGELIAIIGANATRADGIKAMAVPLRNPDPGVLDLWRRAKDAGALGLDPLISPNDPKEAAKSLLGSLQPQTHPTQCPPKK